MDLELIVKIPIQTKFTRKNKAPMVKPYHLYLKYKEKRIMNSLMGGGMRAKMPVPIKTHRII